MNLFFSELLQTIGVAAAAYVVLLLGAMGYKRLEARRAAKKSSPGSWASTLITLRRCVRRAARIIPTRLRLPLFA